MARSKHGRRLAHSRRRCEGPDRRIIARLAGFGKDRRSPPAAVERGPGGERDRHLLKANIKRDGDAAPWYTPMLDEGRKWPVRLKIHRQGRRRGAFT